MGQPESATTSTDLVTPSIDEFLEHHGVKGMRWGVRKRVGSRPAFMNRKKKPEERSEDAARALDYKIRAKQGGSKTLSNKELRDLVERMNLEQQYSTLSAKNKQTIPGMKFTQEALRNVAMKQATWAGNEVASIFVKKGMAAMLAKASIG